MASKIPHRYREIGHLTPGNFCRSFSMAICYRGVEWPCSAFLGHLTYFFEASSLWRLVYKV